MIRHPVTVAVIAAAACTLTAGTLTACGSASSGTSSAQSRLSEISAATHPSTSAAAVSGPKIDPAGVDVCALLSAADANTVAHAEQLDEFQTPSTVYAFTAAKQTQPGGSACRFRIAAPPGEDGQGSVVFRVVTARGFAVPPDGRPITGLGDEAYDTGTSPVVRVGTVVISSADDSFSDSLTVALLRTIVPKIK